MFSDTIIQSICTFHEYLYLGTFEKSCTCLYLANSQVHVLWYHDLYLIGSSQPCNTANTMFSDALAPCVTRSSATMIIDYVEKVSRLLLGKCSLAYMRKDFQLPVSCYLWSNDVKCKCIFIISFTSVKFGFCYFYVVCPSDCGQNNACSILYLPQ